MNLGNQINSLRKARNITQEELAAELGVTAAAVSKWEKGYTLPDILMLCALADFFCVTTDELLGRTAMQGRAVIAGETPELAEKIRELGSKYGIITDKICGNALEAAAAVRDDPEITHLLMGFYHTDIPLSLDIGRNISMYLCISDTDQGILSDLRNALANNG